MTRADRLKESGLRLHRLFFSRVKCNQCATIEFPRLSPNYFLRRLEGQDDMWKTNNCEGGLSLRSIGSLPGMKKTSKEFPRLQLRGNLRGRFDFEPLESRR